MIATVHRYRKLLAGVRPRDLGRDLGVVAAIHALVFVATLSTVAIVPLLPQIVDQTHISATGAGFLLAIPNLAMLIVSIPVGLISDRIGPRAVTRAGAVALVVGTVGQGLSHSFLSLMAMRLLIGAADGVAWTAGLAWMAELSRGAGTRTKPVAATATSGGLGLVAGPALSAPLAQWLGSYAALLIVGATAVPVMVAMLLAGHQGRPGHRAPEPGRTVPPTVRVLRGAWREPALVGGSLALVLSGLSSGAANLLAPIELRDVGVSAEAIGLVFAVAAGLNLAATVFVIRLSARLITLAALGAILVALAAAQAPAGISVSAVAVAASLLAQAPLRAALTTISYPLSADGHRDTGMAMGVLNGAWASAGVVGPPVAGALAQLASPRLVFALLAAGSLLCGLVLVRHASRPRPGDPACA